MFDLRAARNGGPGPEPAALQGRSRVGVAQDVLGLRPGSPSEPAGDEAPAEDVTRARGVDDRHPKTGRMNLRSTDECQAPLLPECRTDQGRLESSR